jgi:NADH-quinone oxidoreductase subunit A
MAMPQTSLLAELPDLGYGPIAVLLGVIVFIATAILVITHTLPKAHRHGDTKEGTYEAGMPVIGDARRRFNVKFYLVAVMFLIFDVELVFMYPWAVAFLDAKQGGLEAVSAPMLFWVMIVFFGILTLGFLYEWGKGVLTYD